ncbi:MAG: DUF2800 domain-containing protein [Elusimicrobia bacterium]|nr:DUF2800 domain-containing protein [Elusimicrobiota bacterium]MDE2426692.1 DUF2800 domain-containing protein [Elusimicrobiota bacterium]
MKHSPYGGSSASRFMACPGSVALSERAPPETPSPYAEEGTFAHAVAADLLASQERTGQVLLGAQFKFEDHGEEKAREVTPEIVAAVEVYLDAVWEEFDLDLNSEIEVEQGFALDIEAAEPGEVFGTNDALVYSPARRKLTIFDYKHGAGVAVSAEDNTQLKFYAIGAMQGHPDWDVREIELVIVQPRAFSATGEGVKRWSLPMAEVIEFPYELNKAVGACKQEIANLSAHGRVSGHALRTGDHCRWCPAATICTAREQEFVKAVREDFAGVDLIGAEPVTKDLKPAELDYDHMAQIVAAYDRLGAWVNSLKTAMDEHLLAGGIIKGWKVVEAVSRRKWVAADQEVAEYLELMYGVPAQEVRPPSLVTITEAKKLLKAHVPKDQYAEAERDLTLRFTIMESKGLTTAPESDRRAAISPVAAEFGSVQLGME